MNNKLDFSITDKILKFENVKKDIANISIDSIHFLS